MARPAAPHARTLFVAAQKLDDRLSQCPGIVDWHDQAVNSLLDDLWHPACITADHRLPRSHRLEEDEPERLEPAGSHEQIAARVGRAQSIIVQPPLEIDAGRVTPASLACEE